MRRRSPSPTPSFFDPASDADGLVASSYGRSSVTASDDLDLAGSDVTPPPSSSAGVTDPLDDFLERYTCDLRPVETVAKLKKCIGPLVAGVSYCPQRPCSLWYTVKPAPGGGPGAPWWLAKASVSPRGVATVASPKLDLLGGWLRLQVVGDADVKRKLYGVRWRITTKWSTSPGRIGRKEVLRLADGFDVRPRWSADIFTPEVAGSLGAAAPAPRRRRRHADDDDDASTSSLTTSSSARGAGARGRAALDVGHCHIRVPRVDAVVDVDGAARTLASLAAAVALLPARAVVWGPTAVVRGVRGGGRGAAGGLAEEAVVAAPTPTTTPPPAPLPPLLPSGPPAFRVAGWPWTVVAADALVAAADRLRGWGSAGAGAACDV